MPFNHCLLQGYSCSCCRGCCGWTSLSSLQKKRRCSISSGQRSRRGPLPRATHAAAVASADTHTRLARHTGRSRTCAHATRACARSLAQHTPRAQAQAAIAQARIPQTQLYPLSRAPRSKRLSLASQLQRILSLAPQRRETGIDGDDGRIASYCVAGVDRKATRRRTRAVAADAWADGSTALTPVCTVTAHTDRPGGARRRRATSRRSWRRTRRLQYSYK